MKPPTYILKSFLNALGTFAYVFAVAWSLFNGKGIFGEEESFLIPVFMLLLFVISASITGLLVLGKPIHLYMNNMKREAFTMLFATLGWLIVFALLVMVALLDR